MVALQDKVERLEKEMSQVKCEVRSEFEVRCIQLEQKMKDKLKILKINYKLIKRKHC